MRRILSIAALLLLGIALSEAQDETGSWTARVQKAGTISINIQDERGSNWGSTYSFNELRGLSPSAQGAVEFQLQNEPGTFYFTGTFSGGHGGGVYTFKANPQFISAMKNLGYELSSKNLKVLAETGFRAAYIQEWKSFGYSNLSLDQVLQMAIHEVTPDYIKSLAARGYKYLALERVMEMRIHDITPEYIDALARAGYPNLSPKELLEFSIADVTPETIAEYKRIGYDRLSPRDLTHMSLHDVDPEFILGLKKLGYSDLSSDRLVQLRNHDVTPEFIQENANEGFKSVSTEDLISMRNHDVDANFIRRAKKDRPQLTVRDLINMRIHED
jgi:hypothetical protein